MAEYKNQWGEEIDPLSSEISVTLYGFDIYMAMNYAERIAFETSDEAAKMRAIRQEKMRRQAVTKLETISSTVRERQGKETRLLALELEKVNREIEGFERRYKNRSERARESKHASSKAKCQGVIKDE